MSDTPRTDEEAYPGQWEDEVVSALFVRKLEREADQLAIELKRMGDVYAQAKEIVTEAYREGAADAQEEIEELQLKIRMGEAALVAFENKMGKGAYYDLEASYKALKDRTDERIDDLEEMVFGGMACARELKRLGDMTIWQRIKWAMKINRTETEK